MTAPAEWAASLTADDVLTLLHRSLEVGDMNGAAAAVRLLALKDPDAAQAVLDALDIASTLTRETP